MPKSIEELELDLENLVLLHGNFHDSVARCYNDMAKAYYREDQYESALEYYSKAAEIIKQIHGEGDEYLIDIHYRWAVNTAAAVCSSAPPAPAMVSSIYTYSACRCQHL